MRRIFIFAMTVAVFTFGSAWAAPLGDFNYLDNVKAYTSENGVRFSVYFNRPIKEYKGPAFYEKSIQMDFPNTYLHPAKRKFEINDGVIKEVLAYQFSKDVVRVRFMLADSQYNLEKNFTVETTEKGVICSLKKPPADPLARAVTTNPSEQKSEPKMEKENPVPFSPPAQEIKSTPITASGGSESFSGEVSLPDSLFASMEPAKPNAAPQNAADPGKKELSPGENAPGLFTTGVKIYGTLFILLAVIFVGFHFAKNYFPKGQWLLNKEKWIDVIATNHLGPKKAISVVEVAGELLVLGVSSNQISMLTRIEDTETIQKMKEYRARFKNTNPLGGFKFPFSLKNFKKKKDVSSHSQPDFNLQLQKFASDVPEPEFPEPVHTAADVARLIQERLGKVQKSERAADLYAGKIA